MNLSELSIKRPVLAWMLMIGLIVFGGLCFSRMGISQLPDVDFPVININLTLPNAAPEVMETDVVDVIEDAVMGIEGIRNVYSSSTQGTANVTVEFELGRSVDVALQEVQTRIAQAQKQLPTQLYPAVITKTNPEDQPILWLMLTNDGSQTAYQQMIYARNTLKDQFSTLSGVGSINFAGYVTPNLRVWLSQKQLNRSQLTADDVVAAITAEQMEVPAGRIEAATKEFNVRLLGEAMTPAEFGQIRISQRGGAPNFVPLMLRQVARIEEGLADIRQLSRFNGKPVVGLGIVKQRGSNAVEVSRLVKAKVATVQAVLPKGLGLEVKLDTTKFIHESVDELNWTLILAAILTSVVCFAFLGSWSSTINVLMAIPTSIVGAFIALYFCGFTINTFTLLGLSLAIGIVVDDAIMMLENIVRHAEMGKSNRQAALDGSKEITFAAIAATIAIAAIFVPVIFMKGIIGRFFYQYGITVTVAVLLSLLEALTLTPMRCAAMLTTVHGSDHANWLSRGMDTFMAWLARGYGRVLEFCLKFRWIVLISATALFAGSLLLAKVLPKELIPAQDQSLFLLTIQTPVGSSIQATDRVFRDAEAFLSTQAEVMDVYSSIGNYGGNDIVNTGVIYVILKDPKQRQATQQVVMHRLQGELAALLPKSLAKTRVYAQDLSLTGFTASRGYPLEFTVQGPSWTTLADVSSNLISKLEATGLISDINSDYQTGMPEMQVFPDRVSAAARGVSVATMSSSLATLIGGSIFSSATQFPKDGHRYDIRVRSEPSEHASIKDFKHILVRNNRGAAGEMVPLSQVTTVKESASLQIISRLNRERAVPIFANVAPGKSQQDALDAVQRIAKEVLPPGYHLTLTGTAQTFNESFSSLMFALLLGILVAYMVLASQFNSFIHPITVLLALPFSLSGAFFALALAHQSLNLFSMIGLILLMGIVKKNSILLVDFTNQRRGEGISARQALIEACPVRLRPILMTSIATIAGAIPAMLAIGPGAETRIPMAVTIVGGVALSTVLTLFVVPCAYLILSRLERPDPSIQQPPSSAAMPTEPPGATAHVAI